MKQITFILSLCVFLFSAGCAKQGSPSGGPKDITPPRIVESTPENYATQFKEKKFKIEFDEFIQLKDINQELIVSPPFKEKPIIKLKGKIIEVEFEDTLKENTTYTFNFGNCITDNNEGNALANYEYVFSTGDYIDSLSAKGILLDAFSHKPSPDPFYVMLYENLTDSAPLVELPSYIHKTNKEGYFSINNVKNDTFRLFALKDANNNLLFDLPNELIAFNDSTVILSGEIYNRLNLPDDSIMVVIDTVKTLDSLVVRYLDDTSRIDTIAIVKHKNYAFHIDLFSFEQELKTQYITSTSRPSKNKALVTFHKPLYQPPVIKFINDSIQAKDWYIWEDIYATDSLKLWITDTVISQLERFTIGITYYTYDSIETLELTTDTITFVYIEKVQKRRKDEDETAPQKPVKLTLSSKPATSSTMELNDVLTIFSSLPVDSYNTEKIEFVRYIDTIAVPENFTVQKDSILTYTKFYFSSQWKENTTYKLIAYPGAFNDIYGYGHDTTTIVFISRPLDYYGVILLNLTGITQPVIIQVMDKNENIFREHYAYHDGIVRLDYLLPKEYMLKIIIDKNNNRKWDTGHYLKKNQPEKVGYYPDKINVRSNWDVEVDWNVDQIK